MEHYGGSNTATALPLPGEIPSVDQNNFKTCRNENVEGGTRSRENIGWADLNFSTYAVYGSAWIFAVDTMLFPLEVMKTRIMAQRGSSQQHVGLSQMLSTVLRQEGFFKLFRGITPSVMGSFPGQATYYTTYEIASHKVKQLLPEGWKDDTDPISGFVIHSTAGAMAEIFAGTFYVPADIISQRLQVQGLEVSKNYSGARDVIRSTFAKEGIRGFYRGYAAYIIAYAPGSAIYWGGYESFKKTWFAAFSFLERHAAFSSSSSETTHPKLLSHEMTTSYVHALSGACAGFCSCVANNPLDMMRTRIQLLEPGRDEKEFALLKKGYWHFAAKVAREEGWRAFYRGLKPRLVVAVPGSVLALSGYEAIKSWSMTKVQPCPLGEDAPPLHRVIG